jgi:DNA-directed RNA polymerase specialized sigma24 family protein
MSHDTTPTLRVMAPSRDYVDPHPVLPETDDDTVHQEPGSVWFAMLTANQVALAENMLEQARSARAAAARELHVRRGWPLRRVAELLNVTEGAVRFMIAKYEGGK